MKNLFNININNIRYNNSDVLLIKLNGDVLYEKVSLYIPYEFRESEVVRVETMVSTPHTDLSYMFYNCYKLVGVNSQDWNTSNVTTMSNMFVNCYNLDSVDMSNWDTSNVIDMSGMFVNCDGFCSLLDISNFNTSNVTNMRSMFSGCYNLTELDISNFRTSNVIDMSYMFNGCSKLTELDVSSWDTSSVTDMAGMFSYCQSLSLLDVSNFDTSNVTDMNSMFGNCPKLTELDVSNWVTNNVIDMAGMFMGCELLETLDLSNWDFSNVTNVSGMFYNCSSLYELHLDSCNKDTLSKIISQLPTNTIGGTRVIYCKKSAASGLAAPNNWVFSYVYEEEPEVPTERPLYVVGEFINNAEITEVNVLVDSTHTDLSFMFSNCTYLTSVNTTDWDTRNVNNMNSMFNNCRRLPEFNMRDFRSSTSLSDGSILNSVSTDRMFMSCKSLTTLDASEANISIDWARYMFSGCNQLVTLDLSGVSMDKCTTATDMFSGCTALVNFIAPKNINVSIDFGDCTELTHDSLMSIINNLATVTSTKELTLWVTSYYKLTSEERKIATDKGWQVICDTGMSIS